jgi:hypothetical protein
MNSTNSTPFKSKQIVAKLCQQIMSRYAASWVNKGYVIVFLLVGVKWWTHVSSAHDLMHIVVSLSCIMLQETERPSFCLLCCHLLTHEPTIWNRSYNTVTHFLQYAAQCHRLNQGQMPYTMKLHVCLSLNEFLDVCSVDFRYLASSSNSFVGHQFGPVRCKPVAPYGNLLPWQCIESALSPYTSASCRCILAADIFFVPTKNV